MRRTILLTALVLVAGSGAAFADHHRGGNDRVDSRTRVTIRNPHDRIWPQRTRPVVQRRPVIQRRPIYVSNGYYQFDNGYRYRYARPVIHRRYFNYRVRPQIIVENYQPVAGYVWIPGQWQWNGYEWIWSAGYYQIDPAYSDSGYSDPGYDPAYDDGVRY